MEILNSINAMLIDKLGPLGPLMAVGGLGVLLVLLALPTMLRKQVDPLDKLRQSVRTADQAQKPKGGQALRNGGGVDKLEKFANFLEPQDAEEMGGGAAADDAGRLPLAQRGADLPLRPVRARPRLPRARHDLCDDAVAPGPRQHPGADPLHHHPRWRGLLPAEILGRAPGPGPPAGNPRRLPRRARHDAGLRRGRPVARPVDHPRRQGDPRRLSRARRRVRHGRA